MTKRRHKKFLKIILGAVIALFVLLNVGIIIQAYSLTHFDKVAAPLSPDYKPTFGETVKIAICGLRVPKPTPKKYPARPYDTLHIAVKENEHLEAWLLHTDSLKHGLVIAFHGYMDEKSSMLDRADVLLNMGYDVLLVDFMGAGGSYGIQTTMGFLEAENVKAAYDYATIKLQEEKITLLGFSMGAAAIMKAQHDYDMLLKAVILEAPYATFKGTVNKRLDKLHIPYWPVSNLFTFWTGAINGFNASDANPIDYGKKINIPTLVMCGEKDPNIPKEETMSIYDQLAAKDKKIKIFEESAHESYLIKYPEEWTSIVRHFLNNLELLDVYS